MKYKLLAMLLLFSINSLFGQNRELRSTKDTLDYTFSKRFVDNWDIGVSGGINLYFGEEDHLGNFWKRLSPSGEVAITKMATPIISFRGMATVGQVNGWYNSATPINPYDGRLHYETFNLVTAQLHVLFNISNAIWGYNPKRRFSMIPFIGVGAAWPWGSGRNNRELIFPIGLLNRVYLSPKFDFTIELRHMLVNPRMNYVVKKDRLYEGMGTISFGVSYKFGHKRNKTSPVVPAQSYSQVTNKDLLLGYQQQAKNDIHIVTTAPQTPVFANDTIVVRDTVHVVPPLLIFFPINSSFLSENELVRIDHYLRFVLSLNPNKEFKLFDLSGHADKATGNAKINQRLSEQRVEAVRQILINKYNIDSERILLKAEGDTNNPFGERESPNRVVILQ
ncbi:MAG: OmpA family protein [Bacteroidales bacterium]